MELRPDKNRPNRSFVRFDTERELRASHIFTGLALLDRLGLVLGLSDINKLADFERTIPVEGSVTTEGLTLPTETDKSVSHTRLIRISKILEDQARLADDGGYLMTPMSDLSGDELRLMASAINPYIAMRADEQLTQKSADL
ncbi:MAG TPA: hypothetical protein VMR34_05750 [Candidatus Saccharimonadales bacterium]|nr:hypothetical protein [Candidatus Saccharimonadales bacterium]